MCSTDMPESIQYASEECTSEHCKKNEVICIEQAKNVEFAEPLAKSVLL